MLSRGSPQLLIQGALNHVLSKSRNAFKLEYNSEYCHRESGRYGGSAIFILSEIKYKRRFDLSLNVLNCESVWIEANFSPSSNLNNLIIACIYSSPSSSIPDFLHHLAAVLNIISAENQKVVLIGDININLLDTDSNSKIAYSGYFLGFGLESLIS